MSEQAWISSKEASRCVRRAGFSEGDLAQWAEAGSLRSRAGKGRFSDDEEGDERILELPESPEKRDNEIQKRKTLGIPWPDIPTDFWHWLNINPHESQMHWGSGVFATMVHDDTNSGPNTYSHHIKLLNVTFLAADLDKLLSGTESALTRGTLPSSAKSNDRKYEERAHKAAEIIRKNEGVSRAKAFRRVVDDNATSDVGTRESRVSALRRAYDLMYDPKGSPIKKDQD